MCGGRHLLTLSCLTFVRGSPMFYTTQHCGGVGNLKTAFTCHPATNVADLSNFTHWPNERQRPLAVPNGGATDSLQFHSLSEALGAVQTVTEGGRFSQITHGEAQ